MSKHLVPETKRETKLVSAAKSGVRSSMKAEGRMARTLGATGVVTTIALEKKISPMIPTVDTPFGKVKATAGVGLIGLGAYALAKNPGVVMTTIGMSSIVFLSRGV